MSFVDVLLVIFTLIVIYLSFNKIKYFYVQDFIDIISTTQQPDMKDSSLRCSFSSIVSVT
jgi:hypothetical protein